MAMSGADQASTAADDILIGAAAIWGELRDLGIVEGDGTDVEDKDLDKVYYLAKAKKLPIGKFGKSLIASRTKLRRAVLSLVS
jgi:hypothetical protein